MPLPNLHLYSIYIQQIDSLPVKSEKIAQFTPNDPILSKVITFVQQGWPTQIQDELKPLHKRKDELTVEANCLLWGRKVIVPENNRTGTT